MCVTRPCVAKDRSLALAVLSMEAELPTLLDFEKIIIAFAISES